MHMRLFSADTQPKVEAMVNAWLAELETAPTIHVSTTNFDILTSMAGFKTPQVTVTVWYS